VFEAILKEDYQKLPAYATSFFPLAYRCAGRPLPDKADRGIRALMVQDETGYTNDHVAATFHASHYYRLVGEATPRSREMVAGVLQPATPPPPDPELLSWGHLMPVLKQRPGEPRLSLQVPGWVAGVAIDHERLAVASSDSLARLFDLQSGRELLTLKGHEDAVAAVQVLGRVVAT